MLQDMQIGIVEKRAHPLQRMRPLILLMRGNQSNGSPDILV